MIPFIRDEGIISGPPSQLPKGTSELPKEGCFQSMSHDREFSEQCNAKCVHLTRREQWLSATARDGPLTLFLLHL